MLASAHMIMHISNSTINHLTVIDQTLIRALFQREISEYHPEIKTLVLSY